MITRKQFLASAGAGLTAPAWASQTTASSRGPRPKNVLVLMSDQHHPRAMSCLGDPHVRTPNLDALVAGGTSFHSMYCSNPVCGPSRASFLTGLYTHHHRVVHNDVPWRADLQTVAHYFSRAGYLSAIIGKAHFADGQTHGFDYKLDFNEWFQYLGPKTQLYADELPTTNGGCGFPEVFSEWEKGDPWAPTRKEASAIYSRTGRPSPMPEEDHQESWVARESVRFIKNYAGKRPLFLIASFLKPHNPFTPPPRFVDPDWQKNMLLPDTYGKVDLASVPEYIRNRITNTEPLLKDPGNARLRLAMYNACISYMDHCVGQVMDALKAAGILDDTIVVYTADHGEMRGEHGLWDKFVFYESSAGVPCVVRAPGVTTAGAVCQSPVSQVALVATLLDLCGLPVRSGLDEPSLVPFLRDPGREQDRPVYSEFSIGGRSEKYMIRDGDWKYCYYMGDIPELYNLREDPLEMKNLATKNLAGANGHRETAGRLQKQLLTWRRT
jgi:choline-sulfatase